jgi:hypothetical protein
MTWCDDGTVLYHGTQDPDGVVENGLDPGHRSAHLATGGHEHTDQLYLSPKKSVAERFGESVKVCVRGVDHLAPDPEFTTNESLTYSDEIPPEDVRQTKDFTAEQSSSVMTLHKRSERIKQRNSIWSAPGRFHMMNCNN